MKRLGFGVYKNYDAKPSCLEALAAGYRSATHLLVRFLFTWIIAHQLFFSATSHIDSAQMYRNEAEVGEAIRESGIPREDVFVSAYIGTSMCTACQIY